MAQVSSGTPAAERAETLACFRELLAFWKQVAASPRTNPELEAVRPRALTTGAKVVLGTWAGVRGPAPESQGLEQGWG